MDGFPGQLHNPITDHNDLVDVMPERLMRFVVSRIDSDVAADLTIGSSAPSRNAAGGRRWAAPHLESP